MTDSTQRPRKKSTKKNTFTTKSGKSIKVNRTLGERMRASREAKAQRKAAYLSTLPKEPWKRFLYRMHPKRLYKYWFSRDGGIMALKVLGIGFVVGFLVIVGLFAYFRKDLPKIKDLNSANSGGSVAYYDRTGKVLLFQDYTTFKRLPVGSVNDISKYMREATIAIEDKDFYHEGAFNVKGITRAAINNATGGSTQGGSTITQQLVKINEGWTNDHTVSRKVKELILAVELEREYSKDDILTAYLNSAPYSGLDSGVEAAAQDIFGVHANQLSLAQAAMLAAIPKSPGSLSPYASPTYNPYATADYFDKDALLNRQQYILDLMAQQGYITKDQAAAAKKVDVVAQVHQRPQNKYAGIQYPYFYQAAQQELEHDFPASVVTAGGLKVITTLDVNTQNLVENAMNNNARLLHNDGADDAAMVVEDNTTGQVVALRGGMDFNTQQVNYASGAPISPGSSIKPYSYATLINDNNNVGAGSMLYDQQGALPGYPCTNKATPEASPNGNCLWDDLRKYYGTVSLRYALGSSLNVPAVKAFTSTNPQDTSTASSGSDWRRSSINTTMKMINSLMGSSDAYRCYDPVALGGRSLSEATKDDETPCGAAAGIGNEAYTTLADHVNGIASIARMGKAIPQTFILKISNNSGKTLKQFEQPKGTQVLKADSAYIVTNMAADPGASYLSGHCTTTTCSGMKFHRYKGWQNAIKTGTNQDLDGLMMSWNTKYTAGIWIGNYDRSAYNGNPEYVTDPIMRSVMTGAIDNLGNVQPTNWTQPSDIKTLPAFHSTLPFPGSQTAAPATDLFPSWYVGKTTGTSQTIDRVSNKLATSCTPTLARQSASNTATSQWNVDIYMGGKPSSSSAASSSSGGQQESDDVHSCSDNPPSITITAVNGAAPDSANAACPSSGNCTILVHVDQGTHALTDSAYPDYPGTITLTVNGQTVTTQNISNSGDYALVFTVPADASGSLDIQAQVTDSVLYQGTDSRSVKIKTGGNGNSKLPTSSGAAGGPGSNTLASFQKPSHHK